MIKIRMVRAHVFISGSVQGVFFRMYTQQQARALGLKGWVRNLADGRVEAVFEGPKKQVKEMIKWCWDGSPSSCVKEVVVDWKEPEGLGDFKIL